MPNKSKDEYSALRDELEQQASVLRARLDAIHRDRTMQKGPLSADWQEQATELENEEVLAELDVSQRHTLEAIEAALMRLDAGSYGACTACGKKIATARLAALPFSTLCISCAREREQTV
ncbi:MAG: TraR/DksA family transcriptional regulator [Bradymonadaceae bacterium]|nr:TraR/DksA family transcriptional regulator [Lujinxingiaceae bacterium]